MKEVLFGQTLEELKIIVKELGLPAFTASQIANWLYKKNVRTINEMTDLSKSAREILQSKYSIGYIDPIKIDKSKDGSKKYLYPTILDHYVEAALYPDKDRTTIVISTQTGCKMGCAFCASAKQGFQANLTVREMLSQYKSNPDFEEITHISFSGMGEPFDNLHEVMKTIAILTADWGFAMNAKKITVSTVGVVVGLKSFLKDCDCHLNISLHSPYDLEQKKLMPVHHANTIAKIIDEINAFELSGHRKISFEYIVFKGFNDTLDHAKDLSKILKGVKCKVNLSRYNTSTKEEYQPAPMATLEWFKDILTSRGVLSTIITSRGEDISAASGMLSTASMIRKSKN